MAVDHPFAISSERESIEPGHSGKKREQLLAGEVDEFSQGLLQSIQKNEAYEEQARHDPTRFGNPILLFVFRLGLCKFLVVCPKNLLAWHSRRVRVP